MRKIKAKSEKGAITIVVLVTVLFIISFLISLYIVTGNKAQIEEEATQQIIDRYGKTNEEANEMYYNYYAQSKDVIPIYEKEQLLKLGYMKRSRRNRNQWNNIRIY